MATLTASQSSRNPFRSNPQTSNATGSSNRSTQANENPFNSSESRGNVPASPPPAFTPFPEPPTGTQAPTAPLDNSSRDRGREMMSVLEEPPPYTITPSAREGETTLELGPARPFQHPSIPAHLSRPPVQSWTPQVSPIQPSPTGSSTPNLFGTRGPSILRQLSQSLDNVVNNLNNMASSSQSGLNIHATGQRNWLSSPGVQQPYPRPQFNFTPAAGPLRTTSPTQFESTPPPPRHPLSPPSHTPPPRPPPSHASSSDFSRDFYAAGTGEGSGLGGTSSYSPPPTPPPRPPPSARPPLPPRVEADNSSSNRSVPSDGRPTSRPVIGHPLLKDGQVLVYPKGYECEKCHNVGYKSSDPQRPCKRCWAKYAKSFTGPLAYSFSPESADPNNNFQRPLSRPPPPPPPPPPPIQPAYPPNPPPAQFAPRGYMSNHHGRFHNPPIGFPPTVPRSPPGSVVYSAGDPRIGGRLCYKCHGKGNVSFMLLERVNCDVCGGIGRTFH